MPEKLAIVVGSDPAVAAYSRAIYEKADHVIAINYAYKNVDIDRLWRIAADVDSELEKAWLRDRGMYTDIYPLAVPFRRWDDSSREPGHLPTYITSLVPAVYFAGHHLKADKIVLVGCPFVKNAGTTRVDGYVEGDTDWEALAEQVSKVLKQMPVVPKTTSLDSPLDLEYVSLKELL